MQTRLFRRLRPASWLSAIAEVNAWAVRATLMTSVFVAVGAGLAALGIRTQLRDLRFREAGVARPYLVVRGAQAVHEHDWLAVTLANIGAGPALHVRVEGRLIEQPPEWPDVAEWATRQMVRAAFANEEQRPHPRGDLHAIAAGERGTVWFYGAWPAVDPHEGIPYLLGVHVTYRDLFDNDLQGGADGELWSAISSSE